MPRSHKGPHKVTQQIGRVYRRVSWWPVLGIAILVLGGYTYFQISTLTSTVGALSVALTAEQNDKIADGKNPVAPDAKQIVKDPQIVTGAAGADGLDGKIGPSGPPGEPGEDGKNGQNGEDGVDGSPGPSPSPGSPGTPGSNGQDGLPGANGADGKNGTDGKDGKDGVPGSPGPSGPPGPSGEPGKSPESFTFTMTSPLGTQTTYNCTRPADQPDYTCTEVS